MRLADNKFLSEQAFSWMLSLERKRTDRSRRPFLLLLLELKILSRHRQKQRQKLVDSILPSLKNCTRQTDIIGWYKENVALGVIFTELSPEVSTVDKIQKKVIAVLQTLLTPEYADMFGISFYRYPHDGNDSPGAMINKKLFPDFKQNNAACLCKRIIDIVASLGFILLFSPVMVLVCVAIKLASKGPILFKQARIGQFERPFTCLKFRSMYLNVDSKVHERYVTDFILCNKRDNGDPDALKQDGQFKINRDSRVTPVGRFLRKTSLDELPQLLNVFVGSMSLVGPRPPVP